MRFSVPRSLSPSPHRRSHRRSSTFRAPSSSSDSESSSSSESDSFIYDSESEVPQPPPKLSILRRSSEELDRIANTLASIQLRVNHRDPYEEWEKQTKKDAFRTARHNQSLLRRQQHAQQDNKRATDRQRLAAISQAHIQETESLLKSLQLKYRAEEQSLKAQCQERNKRHWQRIELAIKFDENKVKARIEAERKVREDAEREKKAEEEARRLADVKKKNEEIQRRLQKEREEQEREQREQAEKEALEMKKAEGAGRSAVGYTTALEDWTQARETLKKLKNGPIKTVKADKNLKLQWNKLRREIIPKIGQLTNDPGEIIRVSREIVALFRPPACTTPEIYFASLSSLSKSILLQAEVEVTAEKRSAIPLAHVAANLLQELEGFSEIFWAKLVQRTGGWPIPILPIPESGVDHTKLSGFMEDESLSDFTSRVAGLMRVYFYILAAPVNRPLDPMFRMTRYWVYFARMLSDRKLLEGTPVAPELLATALDVGGKAARNLFGTQWHKVMELLYEGLTSNSGEPIGGKTPEGNAARVRASLEVEKVMNS